MYNIDEIYKMLHWHNESEVQLQGMELARKLEDISLLIQPAAHGSVWDGCARILYEKSDDILEPHLTQLLGWLEDLNWNGALLILERLKKFSDVKALSYHVDQYVKKLSERGTWEELSSLDHLCHIIENRELEVFLPKETRKILQKHYQNPGWWDEE